jgi:UDP-N-acetylglucosamine/UDP-N-acetylgalactosamine diphosphorylase
LITIPIKLQQKLADSKQEHVLNFWEELNDSDRGFLVSQLESIDFDMFATMQQKTENKQVKNITPCETVLLDDKYHNDGVASIKKGEIGVLTVAGGQGTRLGWSGPKGTFPATPVSGKSLFQVIAEQIVFASKKYKTTIPWYIMTSIENDAITRSFLLDNNCFGLDRTDIFLFTQGEVPAVDENGNMLLSSKNKIALNPDGHGGVITALQQSGGLDEMLKRGIKHLSYVQIDNPLAKVIDPNFIGLHISELSSAEASSKCVRKTNPNERVGIFCNVDGNIEVVEYSDLPSEKNNETDSEGQLIYSSGSIALHLFSVEFLQRVAGDLPWHMAHKSVPCIDLKSGNCDEVDAPNAFKFEKFVFDVLPLAKKSIVVETKREEEFAPIKNASGEDSPSTSHAMQQERSRRWLMISGISVSKQAVVELSPLTASCPEDLDISTLPESIESDETLAL